MSRVVRLASATLLTVCGGCGYSGDGKFETHGTWPFSAYALKLPEWKLQGTDSLEYRIRGWKSHSSTYLTMTLSSQDPVVFAELPLELAVTIAEPGGRSVFSSKPDVFAHLKRMQRISAADAPIPGEWLCDHDWGTKT